MSQDHDRIALVTTSIRTAQLLAGPRPLTLVELAERLGVTTRTARRYVYALQLAGVDVEVLRRDIFGNLVNDEHDEATEDASAPAEYRKGFYRLDRTAWLAALDLPAATLATIGGAR